MLSKKEIQLLRSLGQKKYRQQHQLFIAEGEKWLFEIVNNRFPVEQIYLSSEKLFTTVNQYSEYKGKVTLINEKNLQKISQLKTPNQALCLLKIPKTTLQQKKLFQQVSIVCDEIKDPGNMGTIIRTACWFGYPQIICSENCVDVYNPKVVQASMGTMLHMNIYYTPLEEFFENNKDLPVYVSDLNGKPLKETSFQQKGFLVLGNEAHGVRPTILKQADHLIKIEGGGKAESLNVAVAAGILMFYASS